MVFALLCLNYCNFIKDTQIYFWSNLKRRVSLHYSDIYQFITYKNDSFTWQFDKVWKNITSLTIDFHIAASLFGIIRQMTSKFGARCACSVTGVTIPFDIFWDINFIWQERQNVVNGNVIYAIVLRYNQPKCVRDSAYDNVFDYVLNLVGNPGHFWYRFVKSTAF